ncbi:MAG: hypothetical protein JHC87_07765, partial [Thermoleophilaceae bacterium]|nr:hypothetical protein [Thermoleophilaceae bacterium]
YDPFYTTDELCKVTLTPATSDNAVGAQRTLTATISSTDVFPIINQKDVQPLPLPAAPCWNPYYYYDASVTPDVPLVEPVPPGPYNGIDVLFETTSGPNHPLTGHGTANNDGVATFSYSSSVAGTDAWKASAELPEVCLIDYSSLYYSDIQIDPSTIPSVCIDMYCDPQGENPEWCPNVEVICEPGPTGATGIAAGSHLTGSICDECPTSPLSTSTSSCDGPPSDCVTSLSTCDASVALFKGPVVRVYSNAADVTWTKAAPVTAQAVETVGIATAARCHTGNKFRVRPSAANGQVSSMTLFVDGKKVSKTNGASEAFTIDAKKYSAGTHSVKLVTTFTSGKTVTTSVTFKNCKARVVKRETSPRFTG